LVVACSFSNRVLADNSFYLFIIAALDGRTVE